MTNEVLRGAAADIWQRALFAAVILMGLAPALTLGATTATPPTINSPAQGTPINNGNVTAFTVGGACTVGAGNVVVLSGLTTTNLTVSGPSQTVACTGTNPNGHWTATMDLSSLGNTSGSFKIIIGVNGNNTTTGIESFTKSSGPPITNVSPAYGVKGTSVTLTGNFFSMYTTVQFGSAVPVSCPKATTTNTACTVIAPTGPSAGGSVAVQATNTSNSGISGVAGSSGTFVYLTTPTISSVSPASGSAFGGTPVTLTGTGFVAGATTIQFGSASVTCPSGTTATSCAVISPAGSGNVSVTAGNPSMGLSNGKSFAYVVPTPSITSVSPTSGSAAGGTSVTLTGTGFSTLTTVKFGSSAAQSCPSGTTSTTCVVSTPAGASAGATIAVQATNSGGILGNANLTFTYLPVPTITGISPTSGTAAGGTSITLTGTNLSAKTTIQFGAVAAVTCPSGTTSTTCIVSTPVNNAGGVVTVVPTNPAAVLGTGSIFTYVVPTPTITGISPPSGSAAGGTAVTLTGSGFSSLTQISFGPVAPVNCQLGTVSTSCIVTTPAGPLAGGIVTIQAINPGMAGNFNKTFTYVPIPYISTVNPIAGTIAGGTPVTLVGSGFSAQTVVTFNTASVNCPAGTTSTSCTVNAPPGPSAWSSTGGNGILFATNPGGVVANYNTSWTFLYVPIPTITGVSPTSGPAAGGTTVTLTGTGFSPTLLQKTTIQFGSAAAVSCPSGTTSTTCVVTAPANNAGGSMQVQATNLYQTNAISQQSPTSVMGGVLGNSNKTFTYVVPTPLITSMSPTSGSVAGGTPVTLTGTGFSTLTTVQFGSAAAVLCPAGTTPTTCIVNSPIGSNAGALDRWSVGVMATNPGGLQSVVNYNSNFTYIPVPTITSVYPTSGSAVAGTSVTLYGTGFSAQTTVQFGNAAPVNCQVGGSCSIKRPNCGSNGMGCCKSGNNCLQVPCDQNLVCMNYGCMPPSTTTTLAPTTFYSTTCIVNAPAGPTDGAVVAVQATNNPGGILGNSNTNFTFLPTLAIANSLPAANGSYLNAYTAPVVQLGGTCSAVGTNSISIAYKIQPSSGPAPSTPTPLPVTLLSPVPVCANGVWSTTADLHSLSDTAALSLIVSITDTSRKNVSTAPLVFFKQTVLPTIAITPPVGDPSKINHALVTHVPLAGTCSSFASGSFTNTIKLLAAAPISNDITQYATSPPVCVNGTWNTTVDFSSSSLPNGKNISLAATITDTAGNKATTPVPRNYEKGDYVAQVTLLPLSTGTLINSNYINSVGSVIVGLTGTCTGSGGGTLTFASTGIPVSTVPSSNKGCSGAFGGTGVWSAALDLTSFADGSIPITITFTDGFGNIGTLTQPNFNKWTAPPILTISPQPANNDVINSSNASAFSLAGTCYGNLAANAPVSIVVGTTQSLVVPCAGNVWNINLDLSAVADNPSLPVTVSLTDLNKNTAVVLRTFIKDTAIHLSGTCRINGGTASTVTLTTATATFSTPCTNGIWTVRSLVKDLSQLSISVDP